METCWTQNMHYGLHNDVDGGSDEWYIRKILQSIFLFYFICSSVRWMSEVCVERVPVYLSNADLAVVGVLRAAGELFFYSFFWLFVEADMSMQIHKHILNRNVCLCVCVCALVRRRSLWHTFDIRLMWKSIFFPFRPRALRLAIRCQRRDAEKKREENR